MTDEQEVAKGLLALLDQRVNALKQRAPSTTPSQRELFILMLPPLEEPDGAGSESPVVTQARLGSDAGLNVQQILLVGSSIGAGPGAAFLAGNMPFFDIIDRTSGGRSLFESQTSTEQTNRFPITHFANTLPLATRAANYSAFTLPSEYLLAKGAVVEARLFRALVTECKLRIALAGYKVYG
jgi:hypothetical protein